MSKLNRKGFTLVEVLAVITILAILTTVAVVSISKYLGESRTSVYRDFEKEIKTSASNYLIQHSGEIPDCISETKDGQTVCRDDKKGICLNTLVEEQFSNPIMDPMKDGEPCDYNRSFVQIMRVGSPDDVNIKLDYKVCLVCSEYRSKACSTMIDSPCGN